MNNAVFPDGKKITKRKMSAVKALGIECPIIREGDDLVGLITYSLDRALGKERVTLKDKDVIGVTESVLARAMGHYITIDDIKKCIDELYGENEHIILVNPIYSRNRFSMILRGIARSASGLTIVMPAFDEVGNPAGVNPFTGVNIKEYYEKICKEENCLCNFVDNTSEAYRHENVKVLYCGLHDYQHYTIPYQSSGDIVYTLADICKDVSPEFGLLGTNKADGERLKLFPTVAMSNAFSKILKERIKERFGVDVIVCIYGDGCFKDPVGGIWEFADPVTMPGYTNPEYIESTPSEIKLKFVIDQGLNDTDIKRAIEQHKAEADEEAKSHMVSQGTTPRIRRDLLASLMDLVSGSGDRQTPVVLIQGYFD